MRVYKTVKGFLGKPIIESVIMDIDKGSDTDERVLERARLIFHKLTYDYEIDDINIRTYYSGSGFHIQVPNMWDFKTHDQVKATMADSFPDLDTIYDKTRLIRVANTINYKTQRYKIPLTNLEFLNLGIEKIIELAEDPRNEFIFHPFEENSELAKYRKEQVVALSSSNPMNDDGLSPIITCMQKLFIAGPTKGSRHNSMLRMISAYKRSGIPQAGIEEMMKSWAKNEMEVGEIRKIVGDVFRQNYTYSCHDEIMMKHCDSRCMFFKNKNFNNAQPESNETMEEKMKKVARDGTKNVVIDLQRFLHLKHPFKIHKGEVVTILGDTGLGKSALAQNICVDTKKRILYLNFEVGETLMYRRFLQIAHVKTKEAIIEHYLQEAPGNLAGPISHINMVSTRVTLHDFEQLIATGSYEIVIVDTLECFITPGITDITPKTEHIAHELKRMIQKYGCVFIDIHHVSKGGIQNSDGSKKRLNSHSGKGSGAIEQQSDIVIAFEGEADKPLRSIRSTKARDETPFHTHLHFDAENSFRFYKVQEKLQLTSSNSQEANKDMGLNSLTKSYHSSQ